MDETPQSAAAPAPAAKQPRGLGTLFSESMDLAFQRIGACSAVVAGAVVPALLFYEAITRTTGVSMDKDSIKAAVDAGQYGALGALAGAALLAGALKGLAFIALGLILLGEDGGQPASLGQAVEGAVALAIPMLSVFLRVAFMVGGTFVASWACFLLAAFVPSPWGIPLILAGLTGFVFAILLGVRYWLAHFAVLVERRFGWDALARSKELWLAHSGKVFGNLMAAALVVALLGMAVGLVVLLGLGMAGLTSVPLVRSFVLDFIPSMLRIWGIAFSILLYKDLASLHQES